MRIVGEARRSTCKQYVRLKGMPMTLQLRLLILSVITSLFTSATVAQIVPISIIGDLRPAKPTSADTIKLRLNSRTCGSTTSYGNNNPYRIRMVGNNLTITLGDQISGRIIIGPCLASPLEEIDIGRLPPGDYVLTVIEGKNGFGPGGEPNSANLTVADARATKVSPFVRLNYSGTWWDPNDPGWGLFISQDGNKENDGSFIAWFTYTPDGKPMWYYYYTGWETSAATNSSVFYQTARMPGATTPPPTPTSSTPVGRAKLDFTNVGSTEEAKFSYTFTDGPTTVRTIRRFNP